MLAGPKRAVSGPKEPPRSNRVIADNWRGLYGSDPFSSMLPGVAFQAFPGVFETAHIGVNISIFAVFYRARMAADDPKSAIADLDERYCPNSGIPEFGMHALDDGTGRH